MGTILTNKGLRRRKNVAVKVIEAVRGISGKFKVLSLIFSDRDMGSSDTFISNRILIVSLLKGVIHTGG